MRTLGIKQLLLPLLLSCCAAGCSEQTTDLPSDEPAPAMEVRQGDMAPPWSGLDLVSGQQVEFPEVLQGRPAVLFFWATWCPYCKAFMPYAERIQAEYQDRQIQLLTFNAKERGQGDPKAYVESLDVPMIAIADADAIADRYGVKFIPGLMVVDGTGRVIYQRGWTDLPAGQKVAEQWAREVRAAIDGALSNDKG